MTTSLADDTIVIVRLTEYQRRALIALVESAYIRGAEAPLIYGVLRALAEGQPDWTLELNRDRRIDTDALLHSG